MFFRVFSFINFRGVVRARAPEGRAGDGAEKILFFSC